MEKAYFVYRHTAAPNGPQHMYIENIGQTWPVPQIEGWTYTGNVVLTLAQTVQVGTGTNLSDFACGTCRRDWALALA
jgi:hypothetical protein